MASSAAVGAKRARTDGAGSDGPVVLHSYWRSSCSWRVRICLALKGIQYDYKPVHLLNDGGEQLKPAYAEKNPMKELPTLEIDGLELCQSMAIIQYLEETRPGDSPLLPESPADRYRVRQICDSIVQDTQPVQNLRVLKRVMGFFEGDEKTKQKLAWGKWAIGLGFDGVEKMLEKSAGKFCFGDAVTLADIVLVPQVYNGKRFGVDFSKYPTIMRVHAALEQLEPFKQAHPDQMPDAVKAAAPAPAPAASSSSSSSAATGGGQ